LLIALGLVDGPVVGAEPMHSMPTRLLSLSRHSQGLYATRRGWFEPAVRVGDSVNAGQLAGWYHDLERLDLAEEALHFVENGIVLSRRLHTMCEAGDCLMQVAEPVEA
ncbi:MAG: deacylase, partial [Mesorhizobium sp.]